MTGLNLSVLLLAAVALGTLITLFLLVSDSRRLATARADLLWAFLRRRGTRREALVARAGERAVRVAEMRCAACSSRGECLALLAEGAAAPGAGCPNAALFEKPAANGGRP
jgi:hypothetical protein